jgi:hypothetical protein
MKNTTQKTSVEVRGTGTCWKVVNWIHPEGDRDQRLSVVRTVMNVGCHKTWGIYVSNGQDLEFSRSC